MIDADAELEAYAARLEVVLDVCALLLDGESLVVDQGRASVCEVERAQRLVEPSVLVSKRGVGWIRNAERELLVQLGGGDGPAELERLSPRVDRDVALSAVIRQRPILAHRRRRIEIGRATS